MGFKFILLMVMAASMGWWVIPVALVIWGMVKAFSWNDIVAEAKAKKFDVNAAEKES